MNRTVTSEDILARYTEAIKFIESCGDDIDVRDLSRVLGIQLNTVDEFNNYIDSQIQKRENQEIEQLAQPKGTSV